MMKYQDIAHPEDRKALQVLQKVPLLDEGCRNIMEYGYERIFRGENLATMVKANAGSMPVVYQLMEATAQKVGVPTPEVYVYNDPVMNAFTYGETNTFICISSSCIEKMNDEELMCLMAHECGHILCHHVLYNSVIAVIREWGERIGVIPWSLSSPLTQALQYWSRRSEYSADRCAAATMGEKVFQRMMLKLTSGLADIGDDPYQLVRQAKEYHLHENATLWDKIQQNCRMAFYSHPQMVNRAYEIDRWKVSYAYKKLRQSLI